MYKGHTLIIQKIKKKCNLISRLTKLFNLASNKMQIKTIRNNLDYQIGQNKN